MREVIICLKNGRWFKAGDSKALNQYLRYLERDIAQPGVTAADILSIEIHEDKK